MLYASKNAAAVTAWIRLVRVVGNNHHSAAAAARTYLRRSSRRTIASAIRSYNAAVDYRPTGKK